MVKLRQTDHDCCYHCKYIRHNYNGWSYFYSCDVHPEALEDAVDDHKYHNTPSDYVEEMTKLFTLKCKDFDK
jgi:hypothetical protein